MTCILIQNGFICVTPFYRLRTNDGRYIYMDWHSYCGPTFYKDKNERRVIEEWWEDAGIVTALEWFIERGKKA